MKTKLTSTLLLLSCALGAQAITFTPTGGLTDLNHFRYYTWGIDYQVPAGEQIISATLTVTDIHDWRVETDHLYINLLDKAVNRYGQVLGNGAVYVGNDLTSSGNYFAKYYSIPNTLIANWSDPFGDNPARDPAVILHTLVYNFTADQLEALRAYLANDGRFGFGVDPDCHYYNDGWVFEITTAPTPVPGVPDAGVTFWLLCAGMGGLAGLRRFFRI